jgi:phage terminase large subunit-like protein
LRRLEARLAARSASNQLATYRPYPKQETFHEAGARHRERLFMAGNQLGKTRAGASEEAMHATGRYPPWWRGRRFDAPTVSWCAGVTGESTRDNVQRLLLGRPGARGTGALPGDAILDISAARGVAGLADTIKIAHVSGGTSTIALKFYEKGREKWQGETLHRIWFDEEPPADIYSTRGSRGPTRPAAWSPSPSHRSSACPKSSAASSRSRRRNAT